MHNNLPPAEWVRRQFGLPDPMPIAHRQPTTRPRKTFTEKERHVLAIRVVNLVKKGMKPYRALLQVGFPTCYHHAIGECIDGHGVITDFVFKLNNNPIPQNLGRTQVSFVRWYYGLTTKDKYDNTESEKLRMALWKVKLSGMTFEEIGNNVGLHKGTVHGFMKKRHLGMCKANRDCCFAWLETLKK